jgi:hypothetical protein
MDRLGKLLATVGLLGPIPEEPIDELFREPYPRPQRVNTLKNRDSTVAIAARWSQETLRAQGGRGPALCNPSDTRTTAADIRQPSALAIGADGARDSGNSAPFIVPAQPAGFSRGSTPRFRLSDQCANRDTSGQRPDDLTH